jgi:hypothetical protein
MTKQELNRDIKRLFRNWRIASDGIATEEYFSEVEPKM